MHFKEIHFIPEFIDWLGEKRAIQEPDYPRFFGRTLSKSLYKHLKDKMFEYYCSPKQWGGVLCSYFLPEKKKTYDQLIQKTQVLMEKFPRGILEMNGKDNPHITWRYLRECNEALWTKAWNSIRENAFHQFSSLDPWINYRFSFKGLDGLPQGSKQKSCILYLKPLPESEKALNELGGLICSVFNLSEDPHFFPHITLGRVTDPDRFFNTSIFSEIQALWDHEEWDVYFNHALFFRHLDHEGSFPVFGVAVPDFKLSSIQKEPGS